ncbi:MAG: hypothetical protein SVM86_02930 [Candidatus Cloacimonadota bacterium]|nr:hypothetical protein [Candidatus Cloacimonadota bacterium]
MQPSYTFLEENIFMKIIVKIAGQSSQKLDDKLPEIVKIVSSSQNYLAKYSSVCANILGNFVHTMALKHFKVVAKDFWINVKCNLC